MSDCSLGDECDDTLCDEHGPICGESYDHTLSLIDERDGSRTYECRSCGAEIVEDDDEEDDHG